MQIIKPVAQADPPIFQVKSDPLAYLTAEYFKALYGSVNGINWNHNLAGVTEAWEISGTQGDGAVVAIIDTGCVYSHPDLKDNILSGYNYTNPDRMNYMDSFGHGCIRAGTYFYSDYCGIEKVEDVYRRQLLLASPMGVVGWNGCDVKATATKMIKLRHRGSSFKVKTHGGEIVLTPWHKLFVLGEKGVVTEKRADELRNGEYLLIPDGSIWLGTRDWYVDGVEVDSDLAWVFGFFLGDGSSIFQQKKIKNGKTLWSAYHVSFFSVDPVLLNRVRDILSRKFPQTHLSEDTRNGVGRLVAYGKYIEEFFSKALGVRNGKESKICIPGWLGKCKLDVVYAFLAGYLDSDGHVGLNRRKICYTTVSKEMASSLGFLLGILGCAPRIDVQKPTGKGRLECFYVDLRGISFRNLARCILPYVSSAKKALRLRKALDSFKGLRNKSFKVLDGKFAARINFIEKFEDDAIYYDFEVPGPQNYLAGSGLAIFAHNTHCAGIVAASLNDFGVTGVAPKAKLLIIKVLGDDGSGSGDWVASGIRYAVDQGADVISMSLGCQSPYDPIRFEVKKALDAGIIVVCVRGGSFVTISDGSVKKIEDVEIGDMVLTHDGNPRMVTNVMKRSVSEDLIRIKIPTSHEPVYVTKEHPFLSAVKDDIWGFSQSSKDVQSFRRNKSAIWKKSKSNQVKRDDLKIEDFKWTNAGELSIGDALYMPSPIFRRSDGVSDLAPELINILGWYCAEGCLLYNKKTGEPDGIRICLGKHEWYYKNYISKKLTMLGLSFRVYRERTEQSIHIRDAKLLSSCLTHIGKGAREKRLSFELVSLLANDRILFKEFFTAYTGGDGSRDKRRGRGAVSFSTASLNLREQLYWLLFSQKIFSTRSYFLSNGGPGQRDKKFPTYRITIPKHEVRKIWSEKLPGSFIFGEKQYSKGKKIWEIAASRAVLVESISKEYYEGMVYNLEVEGNNSYIVNGVVAHNCAAGNDASGANVDTIDYPARYNNDPDINGAITVVAAVDRYSSHAYFSSEGPELTIAAPGVDIYSTYLNNGYAILSGTCLTSESMVNTEFGIKRIVDVRERDKVWSFDPSERRLVLKETGGCIDNGLAKAYEIKTTYRKLEATENHPFLVLRKNSLKKRGSFYLQWTPLSGIVPGDKIVCLGEKIFEGIPYRLPTLFKNARELGRLNVSLTGDLRKKIKNYPVLLGRDKRLMEVIKNRNSVEKYEWGKIFDLLGLDFKDDFFISKKLELGFKAPEYTTTDFCRIFGFMIGDGYASLEPETSFYRVGICLSRNDVECDEAYVSLFATVFGRELTVDNANKGAYLYSKDMAAYFRTLGLNQGSQNKSIPEWAFSLPPDQRFALLAGYIDSDGVVRVGSNDIGFESSSENLISRLKLFCEGLGLQASDIHKRTRRNPWRKKRGTGVEKCTSWIFSVSGLSRFCDRIPSVKICRSLSLLRGKRGKKRDSSKYYGYLIGPDSRIEKILSVRPVGIHRVYDIKNVRGTHNFVANGIVAHNSMATPCIAGFAALMKSKCKLLGTSINGMEFNRFLSQSARDLGSTGNDVNYGFGLVQGGQIFKEFQSAQDAIKTITVADTTALNGIVITSSSFSPALGVKKSLF